MRISVGRGIRSVCVAFAVALTGCAARSPETTGSIASASQIAREMADRDGPAGRPIDVHDAVARALVHNRSLAAERAARLLAEAETGVASAEMLPDFVASSQVYARSNLAASSSASIADPSHVSSAAYSSPRVSRTREFAASWNVLDFGVAYLRSRQSEQRGVIAAEQLRRAGAALAEETRTVFWRALAHQRLEAGLRRIDGEMNRSIADAGRLQAAGLTNPVDALTAERDLLAIRRELDQQRRLLVGAEDQLRTLMNHPPSAPLVLSGAATGEPPALGRPSFLELAERVLSSRPEFAQAVAEQRITAEEARIALLELLPNLDLVAGQSLDANPYLLNQGWMSIAGRVSWHLVKVLRYPARSSAIEARAEFERRRTRALAAALVLQAQISVSRAEQARSEFAVLSRLAQVQRRLALQTEAQARVGRLGTQAATREQMSTLLAEARRDAAWGDVQAAWANLFTSFGQDVTDVAEAERLDPDVLAAHLRSAEAAALAHVRAPVRLASGARR